MSPASIQLLKQTQTLIFLNETLVFLNQNHWRHPGQLFAHNNYSAPHRATSSAIVQPNDCARAIYSNGIIKPSSARVLLRVVQSLRNFTSDSSNHLLTCNTPKFYAFQIKHLNINLKGSGPQWIIIMWMWLTIHLWKVNKILCMH